MSPFKKAVRHQQKLRMALDGPAGSGKAQPVDTVVPTPDGYRKLGDLRPGDRVFGSNGAPTDVVGVYPQGTKPVYRVTFDDGSSTEACAEHLWQTRNRNGTDRVVSTADLTPKHRVPLIAGPLEYPERELPLDPYALGVLLGDGHLGEKAISLSTDNWIVDHISDVLTAYGTQAREVAPSSCEYVGHYRLFRDGPGTRPWMLLDVLRSLGLAGGLSASKFVPDMYLEASADQRLSLLQGLLDTDGWFNGPSVEYSTVSERLADDVTTLVQTLGGRCRVRRRPSHYRKDRVRIQTQDHWRMTVQLPSGMPPGRLPRKLDKATPRSDGREGWRHVRTVEPSREVECVCIAVANDDHLYVTEQAIVTHNTFTALALGSVLGDTPGVIDSEHGKSQMYGDLYDFVVLELEDKDPRAYIAAISEAAAAGIDPLIIDSLSHAWEGTLELKDSVAKRSRNNDSFGAWRDVTPIHNQLVESILGYPGHVIVTMRVATEYVVEQGPNGRNKVNKVGTKPVQRAGVEYELDVVGDLDLENTLVVSKSRIPSIAGKVINRPGRKLAEELLSWLNDGAPAPESPVPPVGEAPAEREPNTGAANADPRRPGEGEGPSAAPSPSLSTGEDREAPPWSRQLHVQAKELGIDDGEFRRIMADTLPGVTSTKDIGSQRDANRVAKALAQAVRA